MTFYDVTSDGRRPSGPSSTDEPGLRSTGDRRRGQPDRRRLAAARAQIERLEPSAAESRHASGHLLVDIRPRDQRRREGEIPGSVVIERNVLEWWLDPTSDARIIEFAATHR